MTHVGPYSNWRERENLLERRVDEWEAASKREKCLTRGRSSRQTLHEARITAHSRMRRNVGRQKHRWAAGTWQEVKLERWAGTDAVFPVRGVSSISKLIHGQKIS